MDFMGVQEEKGWFKKKQFIFCYNNLGRSLDTSSQGKNTKSYKFHYVPVID